MADSTLRIVDVVFRVEDTAQCDRAGRPQWEWSCTDLATGAHWSAADLYGPAAGPEPDGPAMLCSLLAFLSAALESRAYRQRMNRLAEPSENETLFPPAMLDACEDLSDAIELALCEREEVRS